MGQVWLGVDTRTGRDVAIKILHPEVTSDATARARLAAEARAVAAIEHPNVVAVLDHGAGVGADPEARFLVMEHVPGEDLARTLRRAHRLPAAQVVDLLHQLGEGLDAAHRSGVIHRDVKPANVLLTADGRVVLTDFGIARSPHLTHLTRTGHIIGTAHYLAPEVAQGRPATAASDLYAVGVLAYQCLTGQHPFPDGPAPQLLRAHIHDEPAALPEDVPAPLRRLILDLLAKDPDQRPAGAADLARRARDITALVADPPRATMAGAPVAGTPTVTVPAPASTTEHHRPPAAGSRTSGDGHPSRGEHTPKTGSLFATRLLPSALPTPTSTTSRPANDRTRPHAAGTLATLRWAFGLLALGVAVVLTVAFGNGPATRVPNVVGTPATSAQQRLTRAGFVVRTQPVDMPHQRAGQVVGQVPAGQRTVDAGAVITLQVATGYLTLNASAYQGQPCADTASALTALGLTAVLPPNTSRGTCTVAALSPVGRIPVTATVTLTASVLPPPPPAPSAPPRHGKGHGHGHD